LPQDDQHGRSCSIISWQCMCKLHGGISWHHGKQCLPWHSLYACKQFNGAAAAQPAAWHARDKWRRLVLRYITTSDRSQQGPLPHGCSALGVLVGNAIARPAAIAV
jgi:hypothetical protein